MSKSHFQRIRKAKRDFFSGLRHKYYDYWYALVLILVIIICVPLAVKYSFFASIATSISAVIILAMLLDRLYFSKPSLRIGFLIPHEKKEKVEYTDSSGRTQSELTDEIVVEHIKINPGTKKKIFFRIGNKGRALNGLHIWIDPQDWASKKFHIHEYSKKYQRIEWSKKFKYQKWHNVAYLGFPNDYLVHGNVIVFPLLVDIKNIRGKHPWNVEVSAGNLARECKKRLIVEVI